MTTNNEVPHYRVEIVVKANRESLAIEILEALIVAVSDSAKVLHASLREVVLDTYNPYAERGDY